MKKILLFLSTILILFGCPIYPYSAYTSLGQIDLTKTGTVFEATFVCPKDPSSFTLAIHDNMGQQRDFSANPDWPIIIKIIIIEKSIGKNIYSKTLNEKQMQFTNWQLPSTSIVLDKQYLKNILQPGITYTLKIEVEKAAKGLAKAEVFLLHYVPTKQMKEASNNPV